EIGWTAVFSLGALSQTARLGLWGPTASYLVAHFLLAAATYAYQRSREGFRLSAANTRLLVCSGGGAVGAAVAAAAGGWGQPLRYTAGALATWLLVGTEPVERAKTWRWTSGWLRMRVLARSVS